MSGRLATPARLCRRRRRLPAQHQRLGFYEKAKTKECYHTVAQALEALEEKGLLKSGKEAGHGHHHIGGYELLQNIKSLAFSDCQNFLRTHGFVNIFLTAQETSTS
jgi:hypothetical protein